MAARDEKQHKVLQLEGKLTVNQAADLKELLLETLNSSDSVEVDTERVTRVDLACLQLLHSARMTALRDGKTWTFRNMGDSVPGRTGEEAGFNCQDNAGFV